MNTQQKIIIANNDVIKANFTDGFSQNSEWSSENEQTAFFLREAFHILEKDGKVIKIKADPTKINPSWQAHKLVRTKKLL